MRLLSEKASRVLGVYAAVLGGLYLLMGLVEIVTGTPTAAQRAPMSWGCKPGTSCYGFLLPAAGTRFDNRRTEP
ncbi:MAG: hypothetical protein ACTSRV_10605 [Candidatus Freyarchaeota archaeon]